MTYELMEELRQANTSRYSPIGDFCWLLLWRDCVDRFVNDVAYWALRQVWS